MQAIYTWEDVALPKMADLTAAIAEVHRAAQFLALTAKSFMPGKGDDSQTNLAWDFERRALVTRLFVAKQNFRMSLETTELVLAIETEAGEALAQCALEGKSKEKITNWLISKLDWLGLASAQLNLVPHYDIPHHPIDDGQPFTEDNEEVLEKWMKMRNNALLVINEVSANLETKPEVRTWPHHFDSALHWEVSEGKTINVGFAINDDVLDEPYFYVGPSPYPSEEYQTDLDMGRWNKKGWTGTVLTYREIAAIPEPENQPRAVMHFYRQSMERILQSFDELERLPVLP